MLHRITRQFVLFVGSVFFTLTAAADVRLPALFTDHMVLQQGRRVPIWGWADDGENVTVEFNGQRVTTVARNHRWRVDLAPLKANANPSTLKINGRNAIQIDDVLVGEVWICSGQSNMEWPMRLSYESTNDIQACVNPHLRLFTVPKLKAEVPVADVKSRWVQCVPENVRNFSAVAYYFGRDLQSARDVPVGLIHTSWGGSPAEVWISEAVLKSRPPYIRDIVNPFVPTFKNWVQAKASWEAEKKAAESKGEEFKRGIPFRPWQPSELYNGMIAPLIPYAFRGAIWYQGESNASRAWQYRSLFADLIRNWRDDWKQGDFPFLAVQLAPWDKNKQRPLETITYAPGESDWAELREAQNHAARTLPNVGIAVITDLGDKDDIHPTKKAPVGARLALLARELAHHERNLVSRGPLFRSASFHNGRASVSFSTQGSSLAMQGENLQGFSLAGVDRKFYWADAHIDGANRVIVSTPAVPHPVAVRYGWSDFPVINLYNKSGLPASPFRSDRWPLTTQPK